MEPKTVRRVSGGTAPLRHDSIHDMTNAVAAGTSVLTLDGALPAEFLSPGDRVITRDAGMAVLREVVIRTGPVDAVAIRAGTLGHTRPDQDALLPASQEVLIRDWRAQAIFGRARALVPAARLVDGEFIRTLGPVEMTLVALVFDAPHIIYADGLELAAALPVTEPA
ncbi:Hint domain-containing protein [Roseivivax lentus]|uniref:Hint domain-containing protein n=1 Tax=Roseivivax lentus TaxID=633194 RepID=A0A1N7MZW6_9RHOB|nr:Hint domain-containing protein [Roseivivax lentus]SIS91632.1 Hint domain-containing protein [Roseivivax lentus]